MREYHRDAQRMNQEAQRMARESQKLSQEKMQEYRNKYQNEWREKGVELSAVKKSFEEELKKDGFLKDGEKKYEFEMSNKALKINGKEQSEAMREKYMKLYYEYSGARTSGNFNIHFSEK